MPEDSGPRRPFTYTYRSETRDSDKAVERRAQENLLSIRQSLFLLTGGCEVVPRQDGMYCEKHSRLLMEGTERCDYVAEHFTRSDPEARSRAQIQEYVNDVLGVKDPVKVKRLVG